MITPQLIEVKEEVDENKDERPPTRQCTNDNLAWGAEDLIDILIFIVPCFVLKDTIKLGIHFSGAYILSFKIECKCVLVLYLKKKKFPGTLHHFPS